MSCLALMETPPGEPTETMSITDGHITFRESLYREGARPAIDITQSLSRIGTRCRAPSLNKLAAPLRMELLSAMDTSALSSGVDATMFERMERVRGGLLQQPGRVYKTEEQVAIVMALSEGLIDHVSLDYIRSESEADGFIPYLRREHPETLAAVGTHGVGPAVEGPLREAIQQYGGASGTARPAP